MSREGDRRGGRVSCALLILLLLNLGVTGCGEKELMSAEIVAYATSKGTIQPDSPATASVRVTNTGPEDSTLWVSYSVQDPTGRWHDGSAISNQRTCPSRTVNSA